MSTAPNPPSSSGTSTPAMPPAKREITLISHSMLFYWWPIWVLGFTMFAVTYFEDHRLAILPAGVTVTKEKEDEKSTFYRLGVVKGTETKLLNAAVETSP